MVNQQKMDKETASDIANGLQKGGTIAPSDVLEAKELATLVRFAFVQLPGEYQVLLMQKYIDGLTTNQIAEGLESSETAVRSKLARARKAFRRALNKLSYSQ